MNKRRMLNWLAFLGAAGVIALIPELLFTEVDGEARPVARDEGPRQQQGQLATLRSEQEPTMITNVNENRTGDEVAVAGFPRADLFAAHSWHRPAPVPMAEPAPTVAPRPAPSAPSLPLRFIGRLDDSRGTQLFLQWDERIHLVRVGDVIEGTYRLERLDRDRLTLIYLPLRQSQSLAVGSPL
ncbi:hypothetical protein C7H85_09045 [Zobellella endophytica]|uniref:Secretion system X translation initiation factor n=1 Tax=Zobellella endophytica TaxID=2116700 RepID=A0A2P7R982_9GAMM|nr:hypothetical protein [Zobellella endophytica]PSJ46743.1 hypothetical protein C7H85_09045 [Zobellella endophytica]